MEIEAKKEDVDVSLFDLDDEEEETEEEESIPKRIAKDSEEWKLMNEDPDQIVKEKRFIIPRVSLDIYQNFWSLSKRK